MRMEVIGSARKKTGDVSILQYPAGPDAAYRKKAGKQHCGYATNLTEACGENGCGIVTDYQYAMNTHSDAGFTKKVAASKNIEVVNTDLTKKQADDILAGFQFSGDGQSVTECQVWKTPKCYR